MNQYHRRSIRLKDYDYAQAGVYFLTLCTYQRECLLGDAGADGTLTLSAMGQIVEEEWQRSVLIRKEIELDAFVVMPNHVHSIVVITSPAPKDVETPVDVGAHGRAPKSLPRRPHSLGSFIAGFKSAVTARINAMDHVANRVIWQRNYFERIIRNARTRRCARIYRE